MSIELLERVQAGGRVDRDACVIRGVKICGRKSRNKREYLESALRAGASLYEGAAVFANHADQRGPLGENGRDRDVRDRFGTLRSVRYDEDGLYGDLHYNPKHHLAEQVLGAADHAPDTLGLSHQAYGRGRQRGDVYVVEAIERVASVDIVAQPASTSGLFESLRDIGGQLADRVERCRQRIRRLESSPRGPRSCGQFAGRLLREEFALVGDGFIDPPDVTVSRFIAEAEKVLRRDDLTVAKKVAAIEKLLTAAEEAQGTADTIDQTIEKIVGTPKMQESYRGRAPRAAEEFVERIVEPTGSADAFASRLQS